MRLVFRKLFRAPPEKLSKKNMKPIPEKPLEGVRNVPHGGAGVPNRGGGLVLGWLVDG